MSSLAPTKTAEPQPEAKPPMLTAYAIIPPTQVWPEGQLDWIPFKSIFFPAGEPHIEITHALRSSRVVIDARLSEPHELVRLLCLTDALRRAGANSISLFCPYFPGGRQDRVEPGTGFAFTLKVFADIINAQRYDRVVIVDPHSDVTTALVDRVEVVSPGCIVEMFVRDVEYGKDAITDLIAPDAGGEKRVERVRKQLLERLPERPIVQASKHRDPRTGELSHFELPPLQDGHTYLVVDDICDGGGTFLGLAEQAGGSMGNRGFRLGLYVTHGIFSKGLKPLTDAYDFVWTTDSVPLHEDHSRLDVFQLWTNLSEDLFLPQPI